MNRQKILLFCFGCFFLTTLMNAQKCRIKIKTPVSGNTVQAQGLVTGTAHIPKNTYLWVVAHHRGFYGWWPQGNGPVKINNHKWETLVHYGLEKELGKYEILAVVVDEKSNAAFEQWVREAPNKKYPPMMLPETVATCPIKRRIVEKVRTD